MNKVTLRFEMDDLWWKDAGGLEKGETVEIALLMGAPFVHEVPGIPCRVSLSEAEGAANRYFLRARIERTRQLHAGHDQLEVLVDCGVPITLDFASPPAEMMDWQKGSCLQGFGELYGRLRSQYKSTKLVSPISAKVIGARELKEKQTGTALGVWLITIQANLSHTWRTSRESAPSSSGDAAA